MNVPPMVSAILLLRPSLPPVSDELRKRVQSIRVRSVVEAHTTRTSSQNQSSSSSWRNKQTGPSAPVSQRDTIQRDTLNGHWRQSSGSIQSANSPNNNQAKLRFKEALADVWQESRVRRFTIFVFISMLAYSSQDLILEPFAGTAFGLTPGETTSLSGLQHAGVLCGMLLCGFVTNKSKSPSLSSLRMWTVGGCIASALAMLSLVMSGIVGPSWPFLGTVFILGVSNGAFSIAAIGSMMQFAGLGKEKREGVRMGVWGAAQAIAFGLGGILGTGASDLARYLLGDPVAAYASVFFIEAILFMAAAILSFYIRPVERVVQIEKQNTSISGRLISHGGSS